MAKIKVVSKCELYDGMSITFKAPCDSGTVDGLNVYDNGVKKTFSIRDAQGTNLAGMDELFSAGTYVKVVLDTTNSYAYIQNGDTNSYLEAALEGKASENQGAANAGKVWTVGPDGSLVFTNPVAKFSQGPVLITESQTLDLTQYGLKAGDQINVVCVGGGGGGGGGFLDGDRTGVHGGGDAGKAGDGYRAGGGGGGYGAGGGGGPGIKVEDDSFGLKAAGGGGGGGYLAAATITLEDTSVEVTIGAGGTGGYDDGSTLRPPLTGTDGGPTSFGSYLTAEGGKGGNGSKTAQRAGSGVSNEGGLGGNPGGTAMWAGSSTPASGGGGGGGWVIESFTVQSGSAGMDGIDGIGGDGGTSGGAGATSVKKAQDGGIGHGVVVFWY